MMVNRASARISSAADKGEGRALIGNAKARQLYELAIQCTHTAENSGAHPWLRGREAVLAAVLADLAGGDAIVCEAPAALNQALAPHAAVAARSFDGFNLSEWIAAASRSAARRKKKARVTVLFLPAAGPHALLPDIFLDQARSLPAAAALPLLFVRDPRSALPPANGKARNPGSMPSIPVDAEDVLALYRVAHESIARARTGGGPTQIACVQWRSPDGKRAKGPAGERVISRLEHCLQTRGFPVDAWREEIGARSPAAAPAAKSGFAAPHSQPFPRPNIQSN